MCPECEKETRQEWDDGHPATSTTPAEYPGYECGWCGHVYTEDREAAYADYKYDEMRAYE